MLAEAVGICASDEKGHPYWHAMRPAELAAQRGDYPSVISWSDRAILAVSDQASAYVRRGYTYHRLFKYREASADYTEGIRLDPNLAFMYVVAYAKSFRDARPDRSDLPVLSQASWC